MPTTVTAGAETGYDHSTETMLVAPEASPRSASGTHSAQDWMELAECRFADSLTWVPDYEPLTVPDAQFHLCEGCPVQELCLVAAAKAGLQGYWGGTTQDERLLLQEAGALTAAAVKALHFQRAPRVRRPRSAEPTHLEGAASEAMYRKGCGCAECRACHAAQRRRERLARQTRQTGLGATHNRVLAGRV